MQEVSGNRLKFGVVLRKDGERESCQLEFMILRLNHIMTFASKIL